MTPVADNDNHRPILDGDHPYRTKTKFQRDTEGNLLRDADGLLMPIVPLKDETTMKRVSSPEDRKSARARISLKLSGERKAMSKVRKPITTRQAIGDPACAVNDNEDFPLLAVLRRDNLHHLIKTVREYRRLVALCEAEPLKGQSYGQADGMATEYRNKRLDGVTEVDAAAEAGFKGKAVPGGEIEYRNEVKKAQGSYSIPAKRKKPVDVDAYFEGDGNVGRTESLHVKLTDEVLIEHIDQKPILAELRASLGPLRDPFEDAVLGGRTFTQIGKKDGFGVKPDVAGRAMVFRAFAALEGAWHDIAIRERRLEKTASRLLKAA